MTETAIDWMMLVGFVLYMVAVPAMWYRAGRRDERKAWAQRQEGRER